MTSRQAERPRPRSMRRQNSSWTRSYSRKNLHSALVTVPPYAKSRVKGVSRREPLTRLFAYGTLSEAEWRTQRRTQSLNLPAASIYRKADNLQQPERGARDLRMKPSAHHYRAEGIQPLGSRAGEVFPPENIDFAGLYVYTSCAQARFYP